MHVMDGLESTRRFRALESQYTTNNPGYKRLVIIGCSANSDDDTRREVVYTHHMHVIHTICMLDSFMSVHLIIQYILYRFMTLYVKIYKSLIILTFLYDI